MGASGGVVAGSGLSAGFGLATGLAQSKATKAQAAYQQQVYELNAQSAELQARDAIIRGQKTEAALRRQSKQLIGKQRAEIAAQGIDVSTGSAAEIQAETRQMTTQDAIEIQNNAWREAWGYRFEAQNLRSRGVLEKTAADFKATQTLLTSGIQAGTSALGGLEAGWSATTPPR